MQEKERLSCTHLDFLSAFICIGEECLTHWTLLDDTDLTDKTVGHAYARMGKKEKNEINDYHCEQMLARRDRSTLAVGPRWKQSFHICHSARTHTGEQLVVVVLANNTTLETEHITEVVEKQKCGQCWTEDSHRRLCEHSGRGK